MTQVERHRSALGEWEMVTRGAHGVRICAYDQRLVQPLCRREVAALWVTAVVNLGPPIHVDGRAFGSFVAGPYDQPAFVADRGEQRGVELKLSPIDARRLLRVPLHELANATLDVEDLLGDRWLAERLADAPDKAAQLDLVERVLRRRLADAPEAPPEVRWALARLAAMPVSEIAAQLGWSHRRLLNAFREHVGLTPKTVARILRFQRAVQRLLAGEELADVAYACGYYDQAHFNRDFRQFAQTTPTVFLAQRLPDGGGNSVQDETALAA